MSNISDYRVTLLKPICRGSTGMLSVRLLLTIAGTIALDSVSCAIEGRYEGWTIAAPIPEGSHSVLKTVHHTFLNLDQVRVFRCEQTVASLVEEFQFCFPARSHPLGDTPPSISTATPQCSCYDKRKVSPRGSGGRIRYILKAALWSTDQIIASCSEEILLSPCYLPSPPMCLQDFPQDYRISHSRKIHGLFRKVSRTINLSISEPKPLQYCHETRGLHTALTFEVKCEDIVQLLGDFLKPVTGTFEVQLSLRSRTITSLSQLKTQPTSAQIRKIPWITETLQESHDKSWTLNIPPWTTDTCCNLHAESAQYHTTSFSVDFWQKGCPCLLPTFITPFIQRRYSIKAIITLRSSTNYVFHLEIPVQICTGIGWETTTPAFIAGLDRSFNSGIAEDDLSEEAAAAEELPLYLPRESWYAV